MATMKTSGRKLINGFVCALGAAVCKEKSLNIAFIVPRDSREDTPGTSQSI